MELVNPLRGQHNFECKVCLVNTKFFCFGIPLCRNCSTFFRRCMMTGKRYICRNGPNCPLAKDKISKCKGCRYDKCLRAWQLTNQAQVNAAITHNFSPYQSGITSVSHQLVKAYRRFHEFQVKIVEEHHSIHNLTVDKYVEPSQMDVCVNRKASMNALYRILTDCISCLTFPNRDTWAAFTTNTQFELQTIQQCYLTSLAFKNKGDDTRLIFMPGYIVEPYVNNDKWWFEDDTPQGEREVYRGLTHNYNDKLFRCIQKFRESKPDALDFGVILLLVIIQQYEKQGLDINEANSYKDRVLTEWADSLRKRYEEKSHEKLIELMALYEETTRIKTYVDELDTYWDLMRGKRVKWLKWIQREAQQNFDHRYLYTQN